MRLLLARHGETTWNAERRFQGRTDVALSPRGRAQAEALGGALRGHRIAAAYVSPFRRARETAEVALAGTGVPVTPVEELRELSLGEWEGCTVDEVRAREGDPYRAWLLAPHDSPPPGGRRRGAVDRPRALARARAVTAVLLALFGGIALLLYGIRLSGDSLQRAAGGRLRHLLTGMARRRLIAVASGAAVTAIIQSSAATTLMLIGFVSAGLMTFRQTLGIILGADIGTTFTVQLIAFKVTDYALLLVGLGFAITFL